MSSANTVPGKPFTTVAVIFLSLIALLQLVRVLLGWEVVIQGVHVPLWASVLAFIVTAGIAAMVWREHRR